MKQTLEMSKCRIWAKKEGRDVKMVYPVQLKQKCATKIAQQAGDFMAIIHGKAGAFWKKLEQ